MNRTLTLLFTGLCCAAPASAHHIWLEQPEEGITVMRFGEYAQNLREASPGRLDELVRPIVTLVSDKGEKTVAVEKTASGFTLPSSAADSRTIVAEDGRIGLRRSTQQGKETAAWYYPAARWIPDFDKRSPALALDLVPAGQSGTFTLFFKDKPLAKTKVTLLTQSGWGQQVYSDEQGQVSFSMPWKGQYVAEVKHVDATAGKRGREEYDQIIYVTTLSFQKADGLPAIPAGPVKQPKK